MAEAFLKTTSTSTVGWKQISLFGLTWHNSICLPTAEHSKKGEKLVMFWMCVWLFFRILYGHPCLGSQLGGRTIDYNHLKNHPNKMHPTTMPLAAIIYYLIHPSLGSIAPATHQLDALNLSDLMPYHINKVDQPRQAATFNALYTSLHHLTQTGSM